MADSKLEIINIDILCPPPEIHERIPRNFIKGSVDHVAIVLDLDALSKDTRLIVQDK